MMTLGAAKPRVYQKSERPSPICGAQTNTAGSAGGWVCYVTGVELLLNKGALNHIVPTVATAHLVETQFIQNLAGIF